MKKHTKTQAEISRQLAIMISNAVGDKKLYNALKNAKNGFDNYCAYGAETVSLMRPNWQLD